MKEKIESKIKEYLDYICGKSVEDMKPEDFMILSSELKDIRLREGEAERNKKYYETIVGILDNPCLGLGKEKNA